MDVEKKMVENSSSDITNLQELGKNIFEIKCCFGKLQKKSLPTMQKIEEKSLPTPNPTQTNPQSPEPTSNHQPQKSPTEAGRFNNKLRLPPPSNPLYP